MSCTWSPCEVLLQTPFTQASFAIKSARFNVFAHVVSALVVMEEFSLTTAERKAFEVETIARPNFEYIAW